MGDATRRMSRRRAAAFGVAAALCALTCHENSHFHLLAQGGGTLADATAPAQLTLTGLEAVNLADHPTLHNQGLTPRELRTLRPYAAMLSAVDPATGQDLTFLRAVHVTVTAPGHDPVVVARGSDFVAGSNSVGLEVEDVELLTLARTGALTTQLVVDAGNAANGPTQPVRLQLLLTLAVEVVQPRGSCG